MEQWGNRAAEPPNHYDRQNFFDLDYRGGVTQSRYFLLREEKSDRILAPVIRKGSWLNGDGINTLGFILVYIQVLLFALALRRRFRR